MATAVHAPKAEPKEGKRPTSGHEAARRYPNIVAHMMCESLGYFSAGAAANALADHIDGRACACEWYLHLAQDGRTLLQVGADVIRRATDHSARRRHHGYMADITSAKMLVRQFVEQHRGPRLAGWM